MSFFKRIIEAIFGKEEKATTTTKISDSEYQAKKYMSSKEKELFDKLNSVVGENYYVFPQINLSSIIKKQNSKYRTELFRNIDFGIFDKNTFEVKLLIELNDITHHTKERYERDEKIREIINKANIPFFALTTKYDNEIPYIRKRLKEYINI